MRSQRYDKGMAPKTQAESRVENDIFTLRLHLGVPGNSHSKEVLVYFQFRTHERAVMLVRSLPMKSRNGSTHGRATFKRRF